jgi:hypothetical protein
MLTVVIMTAAAALAGPAAAGTLPGPEDSNRYGRHALIDNEEYPGANCLGESSALTRIRVRRPIMFARNRTPGVDNQVVGWRWQLRDSTFALVDQGPIQKATASDQRAAAFKPAVVDVADRPEGQWFIAVKMLWYRAGTSSSLEGSALHYVRNYASNSRFRGATGCPVSLGVQIVPPPDHTAAYGVHLLLDNEHLVPVTCQYPGSNGPSRIDVQGPIVLAVDTGVGVQSQQVSWRFRVQVSDVEEPDKDTIWTTLSPSVGFVSATATERQPAGFTRRSRELTRGERDHLHFRVQVIIRWHTPGGSVAGRVFEFAEHYRRAFPGTSDVVEGHCDALFG